MENFIEKMAKGRTFLMTPGRTWPHSGSLLNCPDTVLLRNQRARVGVGSSSHWGFYEGGTCTPHATISRLRHVSVKARIWQQGWHIPRQKPSMPMATTGGFLLCAVLFPSLRKLGT